jgi:hypothetical protein
VVGIYTGDYFFLLRLAPEIIVIVHETNSRIIGFGSTQYKNMWFKLPGVSSDNFWASFAAGALVE